VYGDLIRGAMREIARVLKPSGWATIVFHNTDAAVWQVIREAAEATGFSFHEASSLDRLQKSHKGYKGRSETEDVAHFDVVFNLHKSGRPAQQPPATSGSFHLDLDALIETLAQDPEVSSRGLQGIHAEVMRRMASAGTGSFVDYADTPAARSREVSRIRRKRGRRDLLRRTSLREGR
jgi:hypothetical protein